MNETFRLITDTACDIPKDEAKKRGIIKMPIPFSIDGKPLYEELDFSPWDFYKIVDSSAELPKTSHIPSFVFAEEYEKAEKDGIDHVFHITINSHGSAMYNSALMGKNMFFEEHPDSKMTIDVIDSLSYTLGYGLPLMLADDMIKNGSATRDKLLSFFEEYFKHNNVYFSVYDLKTVKKSGRVSCTAAFVGEVLGLRPIIYIDHGDPIIKSKIRGDKNIIPALVSLAKEELKGQPYIIAYGKNKDTTGLELAREIESAVGYAPYGLYNVGAAISLNSGTDMVGFASSLAK